MSAIVIPPQQGIIFDNAPLDDVKVVRVVITAAQIVAGALSSFFTIIPQTPSGIMAVILELYCNMQYNGVAFATGTQPLTFASNGSLVANLLTSADLKTAKSVFNVISPLSTLYANPPALDARNVAGYNGAPWGLNITAPNYTAGTGIIITVTVRYRLVDIGQNSQ